MNRHSLEPLLNTTLVQKHIRYWDRVAKSWQEAPPQTLWRTYSDSINIALFARWLPENGAESLLKTDLFDESLGDGLCTLLSSRVKNIVGVDLSLVTVQSARSRHSNLQATAADVRWLPFADETFDFIVSNSTLDHFESPHEIADGLRELHRVLRSGGQLLLTLDNLANPVISLRNILPFRLLNRLNIVPYYVGATLGPRRLCHNLKQAGLEVLEVGTVMHFPRIFTVAMARILERRSRPETQRRFLRLWMSFEKLSYWPTRFLTGYFLAVRAIKR